jgi:hypothetical protein
MEIPARRPESHCNTVLAPIKLAPIKMQMHESTASSPHAPSPFLEITLPLGNAPPFDPCARRSGLSMPNHSTLLFP